jgi:malate dehydrogenase
VLAITLGSHGETMVPVPSRATVSGRPLSEVLDAGAIEEIVQRTRDGGAEIVALLKTGSAYFAPAAAAETMVQAVADNTNEVHPVSAWVEGAYGISGVYVGVPAKLGRGGVTEVVELELADEELAALRTAAEAVGAKQAEVLELLA